MQMSCIKRKKKVDKMKFPIKNYIQDCNNTWLFIVVEQPESKYSRCAECFGTERVVLSSRFFFCSCMSLTCVSPCYLLITVKLFVSKCFKMILLRCFCLKHFWVGRTHSAMSSGLKDFMKIQFWTAIVSICPSLL